MNRNEVALQILGTLIGTYGARFNEISITQRLDEAFEIADAFIERVNKENE